MEGLSAKLSTVSGGVPFDRQSTTPMLPSISGKKVRKDPEKVTQHSVNPFQEVFITHYSISFDWQDGIEQNIEKKPQDFTEVESSKIFVTSLNTIFCSREKIASNTYLMYRSIIFVKRYLTGLCESRDE